MLSVSLTECAEQLSQSISLLTGRGNLECPSLLGLVWTIATLAQSDQEKPEYACINVFMMQTASSPYQYIVGGMMGGLGGQLWHVKIPTAQLSISSLLSGTCHCLPE